jgi:signal transduction histidine kinase
MQNFLSLLFLTLAAVSFGLLLASLPYLGSRIKGRAHPLWALSLTMFAASLGIFSWLVPKITDLGVAKFGLTTMANTLLFGAAMLQAAFFSHLNAKEKAVPYGRMAAAIGIFAVAFDWVRQTMGFDSRVILAAGAVAVTLGWQLFEIRRLRNNEPTFQVGFLWWITAGELSCAVIRLFAAISNQTQVFTFEQIPVILVVFTLLNCLLSMLSYVGISKYWAEKISYEEARAKLESAEIRSLVEEKNRLILQLMAANKTAATGALSATLAHELSQPLTSLHINLGALRRESQSPQSTLDRDHLLDQCLDSARRLNDVLGTLRSMFIDKSDGRQTIHIHQVLEAVRELVSQEASRSGVALHVESEGELQVRGRQSELQHALLNLALNGLQALQDHHNDNKTMIMSATSTAEGIRISVADNGPGVRDGNIRRLFERIDSEKPDGMGIGLWICRHIAERHEGNIAHRPNLPQGAIFEITLPHAQAEPSTA